MKDKQIRQGLEADSWRLKERILMGYQHEKHEETAKKLKAFLVDHDWTQAGFAQRIGVSTAVVNQFIQGKYKGGLDELVNKVLNLLNTLDRKSRQYEKKFIETAVAKSIFGLINHTEACTFDEGKIGVIIGESGQGKSECLKAFAKSNSNTIYLELDGGMTSTMIFNEIAEKLGIMDSGSLGVITSRLKTELKGRQMIVMLDEASNLTIKQLNLLRQIIVIKCHCPMILAGNAALLVTINKSPTKMGAESLDQFTARLTYILNLDDMTSDGDGGLYSAEDVRNLYQRGGIRLTKDAVKELRRICKTPLTGKLHICDQLIRALHTSKVVIEAGQITGQDILDAIDQLNLPVKKKLRFNIPIDDEKFEAMKAIA